MFIPSIFMDQRLNKRPGLVNPFLVGIIDVITIDYQGRNGNI